MDALSIAVSMGSSRSVNSFFLIALLCGSIITFEISFYENLKLLLLNIRGSASSVDIASSSSLFLVASLTYNINIYDNLNLSSINSFLYPSYSHLLSHQDLFFSPFFMTYSSGLSYFLSISTSILSSVLSFVLTRIHFLLYAIS
jgi:hypothetical protein